MTVALVPIFILGGAVLGVLILNMMTAGGTTTGDRINPDRMYQGVTDARLAGRPPVGSPLR